MPRKSAVAKKAAKQPPRETIPHGIPERGVREIDTDYGIRIRVHPSMLQVIHVMSDTLIFESGQLDPKRLDQCLKTAENELPRLKECWSLKTESSIRKWLNANTSAFSRLSNALKVYR